MTRSIFEQEAAGYDAWYDTEAGGMVLSQELDALRPLLTSLPRPWLEVGAGTGRIAAALSVDTGVDLAPAPLALAAGRGVRVAAARAEALPFREATFGAVLFNLVLCFVEDRAAALREARRVLKAGSGVVLGVVLAERPWGRHYQALAAQSHPYYRTARFLTRPDLDALARSTGFAPVRARSALHWPPAGPPAAEVAREGDDDCAGFTAVLWWAVPSLHPRGARRPN